LKDIQFFIDLGFETHTVTAYLFEEEYAVYIFDKIVWFTDVEEIKNGLYQRKTYDVEIAKVKRNPDNEKSFFEEIVTKLKQTTLLEYITSDKYDRCLDHNFNL
jgi:hypothetical protein